MRYSQPLICDIIRKSALFIKHVKSNLGSLAWQAMEYETENFDDDNALQLIRKFTPYYNENGETVEPANINGVRKQNDIFYKQVWKTGIVQLSKAEAYLKYKDDIRIHKYLTQIKSIKHRKALTRFRLSILPPSYDRKWEDITILHWII